MVKQPLGIDDSGTNYADDVYLLKQPWLQLLSWLILCAECKHISLMYGAVMCHCRVESENTPAIYNVILRHVTWLDKTPTHTCLLGLVWGRGGNVQGVGELFKYLVSKQIESIDGLQSSFSQAHGAAQRRYIENYMTHNGQMSLTLTSINGLFQRAEDKIFYPDIGHSR